MTCQKHRMNMNSKLLILFAVITLITVTSVSTAYANTVHDEVMRYDDGLGWGSDQIEHSHPHDRIIWLEPESDTYSGIHSDMYRNGGIIDTNIDIGFEGVMVEIDYAQVHCGDDRSFLAQIHSGTVEIDSTFEYFTDSSIDPEYGHLYHHHYGDAQSDYYTILYSEILDDDTFYMFGVIRDNSGLEVCLNESFMFIVDIYGDCDGDNIEFISRDTNGYNMTASGDDLDVLCIN